jgi:hypothetical protein
MKWSYKPVDIIAFGFQDIVFRRQKYSSGMVLGAIEEEPDAARIPVPWAV